MALALTSLQRPSGEAELSKDSKKRAHLDIKLFGKWDFEVGVEDPGLKRYICLEPKFLPHSGGRHEHKKFGKASVNIVERLINDMMRHGRCGGKKAKAMGIVKNALELIHLRTGKNPVEVLVRALENAAPREEVTRVAYGGIVYPIAVDIAPQRRLDLALRHMAEGAREAAFNNFRTIDECLAEEILNAYGGDSRSFAIRRKEEIERIALSSR
ncbi:MAG: 30S ribosomal protein S7 [Candidatus Bathyarchaeia archaeon]